MTQRSRPWEGTTTGDAGPYSHDDWATMYRSLFNANDADTAILLGSGVAPEPGLSVVPDTGMDITVKAGDALVHGTWYQNDADVTFTVPANGSGNPRIDTIVLRKVWATQTIRLIYLTGTPAASPVPPTLTQSNGATWEAPIADIAVASGAASITSANITRRSIPASSARNLIAYDIQNQSGATLETGRLVYWNPLLGNRAVSDQAAAGSSLANAFRALAGIWVGRTANLGYGNMLQRGVGYIYVDGTVVAGRVLYPSSSVPGAATDLGVTPDAVGPSTKHAIGTALEARTGAGLVLADIEIRPPRALGLGLTSFDNAGNFTTGSAVFVTVSGTFVPEVNIMTSSGYINIVLSAFGEHSVAATLTHFDVLLDNTTRVSALLDGVNTFANGLGTMRGLGAGLPCPAMFNVIVPVTPFALHNLKLQWRTAAATASLYAGAGAAANDVPLNFWAQEVG